MVIAVFVVEYRFLLDTFLGSLHIDDDFRTGRRRPTLDRGFNCEFQRIQQAAGIACSGFDKVFQCAFGKRDLPFAVAPLRILQAPLNCLVKIGISKRSELKYPTAAH